MSWFGSNNQNLKIVKEQLASALNRIKQLQEYRQIHYTTILVMQRELTNAHAALRRKGKALKILHKRIQNMKEAQP